MDASHDAPGACRRGRIFCAVRLCHPPPLRQAPSVGGRRIDVWIQDFHFPPRPTPLSPLVIRDRGHPHRSSTAMRNGASGIPFTRELTDNPLRHDWKTFIGNLAFLMKTYVPVWGSNDALWSLKFEWWFYMLYPLYWTDPAAIAVRRNGDRPRPFFGLSHWQGIWFFVPAGILFRDVVGWNVDLVARSPHWPRVHSLPGGSGSPFRMGRLLLVSRFQRTLYLEMMHRSVPDILWGLSCAGLMSLGFWWQQTGGFLRPLERLKWLGDICPMRSYVVHFHDTGLYERLGHLTVRLRSNCRDISGGFSSASH